MLIRLLQGQLDFTSALMGIFAILLIVFLVLPFHEWAHAFTALKLGDTSVKARGRLTLNPLAHIDPFGALALLLFGFGWAKPVPIDPRNFKRPKLYMAITAVMGPIANIVAALVGGLIFNGLRSAFPNMAYEYAMAYQYGGSKTALYYVALFFIYYITINLSLAVFNLLPIPPLDGSKVVFACLPDRWVSKVYQYQMFITIGLLVLLYTGILSWPMNYLTDHLWRFVMWLTGLPFGLS